ncbi:MAG: O-succinylhomoserine sulfhydrylase [Gammaproteobacteria bacterium]
MKRKSATRAATELVRAQAARSENREHAEALFLTSSFVFDSAEQAAAQFAAPAAEYVYSRFSNPNLKTLAARVAVLEETPAALCTASGMSAILSAVLGICRAGDRVLCGGEVFGATAQLLSNVISKFGVRVQYVFGGEDAWREALKENAALCILETPSNPMLSILDIAEIAALAHDKNALLAVDNCFCPWAQKPHALGADLVIHSATKYLDGQGRVLGGAIAGAEELLHEKIYPVLRCAGPALSPFSAWTISRGMETLPLRIKAHCESAAALAEWLQTAPQLEKVLYAGLPSHPRHALAMQQQNNMGGGIISLQIKGGRDEAWRFINAFKLFSITANFGDAKSTAAHPATTTHSRLTPEHRAACNIGENLVRLSIGLEDLEDIREDLARALAALD